MAGKLDRVKSHDPTRAVFGAELHGYEVGPVLPEGDIHAFEVACGVTLPDAFAAFLAGFGNGGVVPRRAAAGPFYGIFALGSNLGTFHPDGALLLKRPCVLRPEMTDEDWAETISVLDDEDISDADWDEALATILGGVLPLGHQGCTAYHGLVLNGPQAGRVVNLDVDGPRKPHFSPDAHFLDWYERWLDEILSGRLTRRDGYWFGYCDAV